MFNKNVKTNEEKSIFDLISESLDENGYLSRDFELPNDDEGEVKFAAGAMDGICMYHMAGSPLDDKAKKKLEELIKLAGKGDTTGAEKGFADFCKEHRAITIIDELQGCIISNKETLDPDRIFDFAVSLLLHSSNTECVKIGLSILELFDTFENEELTKAIRTIALSDEFTIFSVFLMRGWPTAEKDILECAKHVCGWGRIHCVYYIDSVENETKEWLLYNGTDNDVMAAYSAWDVFIKADVPAIIRRGNLSYEEMHAILKITEALMNEGPVSGISNMDKPEVYLHDVLLRAEENYPFTEEDLKIIKDIRER